MRIGVYHLNQLGDFLFSLPLLASLRVEYPEATIVGVLPQQLKPLTGHVPYLNEVWVRKPEGKFAFWKEIKSEKFDWWIALSSSPESYFTAKSSDAHRRSGFHRTFFSSLLTESIPHEGPFNLQAVLNLRGFLNLPDVGNDYRNLLSFPYPWLESEEERWIDFPFSQTIAIAPGSSLRKTNKRWPSEQYSELIQALYKKGQKIILLGTQDEREYLEKIRLCSGSKAVNLAGSLSLQQLTYFLSKIRLLICNDSGAMHLASVFETPLVALFGPTSPGKTGPYNQHAFVLSAPSIQELSVERVLSAIERQLLP